MEPLVARAGWGVNLRAWRLTRRHGDETRCQSDIDQTQSSEDGIDGTTKISSGNCRGSPEGRSNLPYQLNDQLGREG